LIEGGLFLIGTTTKEVHHHVGRVPGPALLDNKRVGMGFGSVIVQIFTLAWYSPLIASA
jgi:hypothetical protein